MKHVHDLPDVIKLLAQAVARAGTQKDYAKKHGFSPQYLHDVLNGRRQPGDKILDALGLYKDVRYVLPQSADELNRKIHKKGI
jgi:hypothetical protein